MTVVPEKNRDRLPYSLSHMSICFCRTAVQYVNESFQKIDQLLERNEIKDNQYTFLITLLQKDELSRKDVTVITTSLFIDGLSTV